MSHGLSIAILALNEERIIEACLESILQNNSFYFPFEILLIDNGCNDNTKIIFDSVKKKYPHIPMNWHTMSENNLGKSRQYALEIAKHSFIAFIDADCIAPKNWAQIFFETILNLSNNQEKLMAVGSGNSPPQTSIFYKALNLMLTSWFGNFNTLQAKPLKKFKAVNHLPTCNVVYVKYLALSNDGFSKNFSDVCEDLEFSIRAQKNGFTFLYLPGLEVQHFHKPYFKSWANKMFRYGRGQIDVARLHPSHLIGLKGLPLLFGLLSILIFITFPIYAFFILIIYLLFLIGLSYWLSIHEKKIKITTSILFLFLITHFCYAAGELWGLIIFFRKR